MNKETHKTVVNLRPKGYYAECTCGWADFAFDFAVIDRAVNQHVDTPTYG